MDLFIISWNTRIKQEEIFLKYVNYFWKFNNIYFYRKDIKKDIIYDNFKNIYFLEYDEWFKKVKLNKSNIIFYEYYDNLWDFDFQGYNIFTFWSYVFFRTNKWIVSFKNLKNIFIFDFFNIKESKNEYKKLFTNVENNSFIYSINYPSALAIKNSNNNKYIYDIYIPLWGAIDYDALLDIVKMNKKYIFLLWPINHPECKKIYSFKSKLIELNNVITHDLSHSDNISEYIKLSKIILLPLLDHLYDLTRIADWLLHWKVIITNKIKANAHINWLLFFNWLLDLQRKIDCTLDIKLYENISYKKKILSIYNREHNIEVLILQLFKFIKKNSEK